MGFMDKAKKMAEQAQTKLDEAQKQFNEKQGASQQPSERAGDAVRQARPPGAAGDPGAARALGAARAAGAAARRPAGRGAPPPPPAPPAPAGARAAPPQRAAEYAPPKLRSGDRGGRVRAAEARARRGLSLAG